VRGGGGGTTPDTGVKGGVSFGRSGRKGGGQKFQVRGKAPRRKKGESLHNLKRGKKDR